jgi:hypothetical protein
MVEGRHVNLTIALCKKRKVFVFSTYTESWCCCCYVLPLNSLLSVLLPGIGCCYLLVLVAAVVVVDAAVVAVIVVVQVLAVVDKKRVDLIIKKKFICASLVSIIIHVQDYHTRAISFFNISDHKFYNGKNRSFFIFYFFNLLLLRSREKNDTTT